MTSTIRQPLNVVRKGLIGDGDDFLRGHLTEVATIPQQSSPSEPSVQELVSPKQVAKAIGVSESSLKRWCDQGLLTSVRTAGGHRRIRVAEVLRYLRSNGQKLAVPEILGLPPVTPGAGERSLGKARDELIAALVRGDETTARRIGFDLFLSRRRMSEICDEVLAPAFHEIGRLWGCGDVAVYQERRSCEIALRLIQELRRTIDPPSGATPKAIGGTLSGDHYVLPTALAELVLRENGWNAVSLGSGLPAETVVRAAADLRPHFVWISFSHVDDEEHARADLRRLREELAADCRLVAGGQRCPALNDEPGIVRLETMGRLEQFAQGLAVELGLTTGTASI